ncbi:MAG: hypothetical protein MJA29_02640 [Candidatus Omnitrophica bacterium]|nr:hypothetical protein [Candidatus Omnitrophota bacterium]
MEYGSASKKEGVLDNYKQGEEFADAAVIGIMLPLSPRLTLAESLRYTQVDQ